jgi:L-aminopeptidase/D-esterase-like protein
MTVAFAETGGSITDVAGLQVGQWHDLQALTGCSVVLCPAGAVGGVDQCGGAPGTRETDLLRPMHLVQKVHAVLLAGGSAFGLDAASGVMRWLEAKGIGFNTGVARVPIVPAAVIFDLDLGRADVRPEAEAGFAACQAATRRPPLEGNAGAGAGASIGKVLGIRSATKSGIGTASAALGGGVVLGALVVVNAFGDLIDPDSGQILAGARPAGLGPLKLGGEGDFADTMKVMDGMVGKAVLRFASGRNTVIGVVATNAALTKETANKLAAMAQDGVARAIRPAHTMLDGDTLFALSTGRRKADLSRLGAHAAEVVQRAILRAVWMAEPAGGLPSARSLREAGNTRMAS